MAQVSILDPRVPQGDNYNVIAKATGQRASWFCYPYLANLVNVPGYWNRGGIVLPPHMQLRLPGPPAITIAFVRWTNTGRYYGSPSTAQSGYLRTYPWPEYKGLYIRDEATGTALGQPWPFPRMRPWQQEFGTVANTLGNMIRVSNLNLFFWRRAEGASSHIGEGWLPPQILERLENPWEIWIEAGDYTGENYGVGAESDIRLYLNIPGSLNINIPLTTVYYFPQTAARVKYAYWAKARDVGIDGDALFQTLVGTPPETTPVSWAQSPLQTFLAAHSRTTKFINNAAAAIYSIRSSATKPNRISLSLLQVPPLYNLNQLQVIQIATRPKPYSAGTPLILDEPAAQGADRTEVDFTVQLQQPAVVEHTVRLNMSPSLLGQFEKIPPPQSIGIGNRGPLKFTLKTKIDADTTNHSATVVFSSNFAVATAPIPFTLLDADVPRVVISRTLLILTLPEEGEPLATPETWVSAQYTIRLNNNPRGEVRVNIIPSQTTPHPGIWTDKDHVILNPANYVEGVIVRVYSDNRD